MCLGFSLFLFLRCRAETPNCPPNGGSGVCALHCQLPFSVVVSTQALRTEGLGFESRQCNSGELRGLPDLKKTLKTFTLFVFKKGDDAPQGRKILGRQIADCWEAFNKFRKTALCNSLFPRHAQLNRRAFCAIKMWLLRCRACC